MLTRETLECILLALAVYEARARRAALNLAPDDPDVRTLLEDIARHRASAIETLGLITDDTTAATLMH